MMGRATLSQRKRAVALQKGQSMSGVGKAREALTRRILDGDGQAPASERTAAFEASGLAEPIRGLVDKVARRAWEVTDEDIAAARASGLSEDRIFEIVVCAAVGAATRQYDTALAALDAAAGKE